MRNQGRGENLAQMLYLALGDSILSDCFPGPDRGAASLSFAQLRTRHPTARCHNLTRTGLKLAGIHGRLDSFSPADEVKWVALSGGGNDVLLGSFERDQVVSRHRQLLTALRSRFPAARLAVCNVYDPSHGTGMLESDHNLGGKPRWRLVEDLHWLNGVIAEHAGADLVDLHELCLGHPEWFQRDIEPSQDGARAIGTEITAHLIGEVVPPA